MYKPWERFELTGFNRNTPQFMGIAIAATVVGGAMIGSAAMGASAASSAASQSANAQNEATAAQERIYQQQRTDFEPYRKMGEQGVTNYNNFVANPTAYLNSPAYQWEQQQIDKNMNRQLSARGRSNSSYGMNSLANAYGNLGAQEYTNAYNRMLDPIKIGQGAANSTGSAGNQLSAAYGNAASNLGNIYQQAGNAKASLYGGMGGTALNGAALGLQAYRYLNQPDYYNYGALNSAGFGSAATNGTMGITEGVGAGTNMYAGDLLA